MCKCGSRKINTVRIFSMLEELIVLTELEFQDHLSCLRVLCVNLK